LVSGAVSGAITMQDMRYPRAHQPAPRTISTPRASYSAGLVASALAAPGNLNELIGWKFSTLS